MSARQLRPLAAVVLLVLLLAGRWMQSEREPAAPAKTDAPRAAGVELKQTGSNEWTSPAGLVYRGLDPEGRTRVEHIERHARDIPDRDGPHGVFDGGPAAAFATIDEAWRRAQQRSVSARVEGDRSILDVNFGERVGFLGGRVGNQRGHPVLKRVRIVFETGTNNVITAFPR